MIRTSKYFTVAKEIFNFAKLKLEIQSSATPTPDSAGAREVWGKLQTEKLIPQLQDEDAFGFSITKRAPISSLEKSITALIRNGSETGSTATRAPFFCKIRSSGWGWPIVIWY